MAQRGLSSWRDTAMRPWQHARQALDLARQLKERGDEALALPPLGVVHAHAIPPMPRRLKPTTGKPSPWPRALRQASPPGPLPPPASAPCMPRPASGSRPARELTVAIALYRAMAMTFWLPQTEAALVQVDTEDHRHS